MITFSKLTKLFLKVEVETKKDVGTLIALSDFYSPNGEKVLIDLDEVDELIELLKAAKESIKKD